MMTKMNLGEPILSKLFSSCIDYVTANGCMMTNVQLGGMWNEAVVAYFGIILKNQPTTYLCLHSEIRTHNLQNRTHSTTGIQETWNTK
jgi:hypothetical protein